MKSNKKIYNRPMKSTDDFIGRIEGSKFDLEHCLLSTQLNVYDKHLTGDEIVRLSTEIPKIMRCQFNKIKHNNRLKEHRQSTEEA